MINKALYWAGYGYSHARHSLKCAAWTLPFNVGRAHAADKFSTLYPRDEVERDYEFTARFIAESAELAKR